MLLEKQIVEINKMIKKIKHMRDSLKKKIYAQF